MSKRGQYLGGHTVKRAPVASSKGRKQVVGVLNNLPAYNASQGPEIAIVRSKKKAKPTP